MLTDVRSLLTDVRSDVRVRSVFRSVLTKVYDVRSKSADVRSKSADVRSVSADVRSKSADVRSKSADVRSKSAQTAYLLCLLLHVLGHMFAVTNPSSPPTQVVCSLHGTIASHSGLHTVLKTCGKSSNSQYQQ